MPTIYDVARLAKVSPSTVSRVLNGKLTVDEALAKRVRKAASDLDYRPNALARSLRRSQTNLWAVLVSDINNPFFTALVRGVEDVAQQAKYSVVLCNSDENPDKEADYIAAILAEQMAGVIISPTNRSISSSSRSAPMRQLLAASVPLVAIDRQLRGATVDIVTVDNTHAAQLATDHLVSEGFSRIACITGPRDISTAQQRLEGYRRALRASGRDVDSRLIRYADFREAGGHAAMGDLLDHTPRPDAVFATNNLMTVGALECLVDRGVSIPADVGVFGFDDVPSATLIRPPLSTITQPTYDIGRTAAELLLQRIADPSRPPSRAVLPTELHVRASSLKRRANTSSRD
ncbi:LacI family DNA-binding transcriptional regulator [Actinopolymorpha alba]|uniref:LacI family DNA-binding transcriptional regulator n=1 Tax=Actinopolymorpha alba TaxID=533267 RepID=UPI0003653298|nr:LacI family DNA-binding transcriptional regulator [Actinopolymorpha alba]